MDRQSSMNAGFHLAGEFIDDADEKASCPISDHPEAAVETPPVASASASVDVRMIGPFVDYAVGEPGLIALLGCLLFFCVNMVPSRYMARS